MATPKELTSMNEPNDKANAERSRLAVLAASCACFAACSSAIGRHHPVLGAAVLALVVAILAYVAVQFIKLRRKGDPQ